MSTLPFRAQRHPVLFQHQPVTASRKTPIRSSTVLMVDFQLIASYLGISLFGIIIIIALIYSIPIIFLKRFHHRHSVLTLNICFATIICSSYWFIFYLISQLDLSRIVIYLINYCRFASIVPVILTVQVPFSFVTVSVNRLFALISNHPFFKTKFWIGLSVALQWCLCSLLPLPILTDLGPVQFKET